ncbi:MAG TPA: superoxide dismutase family protein [Blastocatellia bacterium]|nr:superoxide dismutase family protein [Blastocatellia bacterium]
MRLITRLLIASLMGAVVLIGSVSRSSADGAILRARARVSGAAGSGISGEILFFQARQGVPAEVLILARVEGLTPNSVHGFHLHENGTCSPDFAAAGGHYDPGPFGMSNPDANHPFHMGDMPNLRANDKGVAVFEHVTSRVTIAPGPLSLFDANGSSVIVHLNEDQGTTGVPGGSGGPRIACGVIEMIP